MASGLLRCARNDELCIIQSFLKAADANFIEMRSSLKIEIVPSNLPKYRHCSPDGLSNHRAGHSATDCGHDRL